MEKKPYVVEITRTSVVRVPILAIDDNNAEQIIENLYWKDSPLVIEDEFVEEEWEYIKDVEEIKNQFGSFIPKFYDDDLDELVEIDLL